MDPRVTEHTSWPPITSELITSLVDKTIADYDELKSLRWAVARTNDDKLIGSCGYSRWSSEQGSAELAYDLAPAYWGFGLMSAAVRAAVAWALDTGSLSRIDAFVMTTNAPSIAVLERTALGEEACLRGFAWLVVCHETSIPIRWRVPANKQLQRTVIGRRGDGASAPFHYALAPRITRQRAAAELRR